MRKAVIKAMVQGRFGSLSLFVKTKGIATIVFKTGEGFDFVPLHASTNTGIALQLHATAKRSPEA